MCHSLKCRLLLIAIFAVTGLNCSANAAERPGATPSKPAKSLTGTWHGAEGTITFRANGTINYDGKRYYYAVTNGGLIQLNRKGTNRAIPYHLSGGKLTLTVNGKSQIYTRK
jgi:hypothetical protein